MPLKSYQILFVLLLFVLGRDSVKIGISKPVSLPENTTTESSETTTQETTTITTTKPTTIGTTTRKVQTTKTPKTSVTTPAAITTTTSSTTSTTSTTIPSTTTEPSEPTNTTQTRLSSIRNENVDYSSYFCNCDFAHHYCDINCCCDIDCIPEELNSFDCQQEDSRLEEVHYQQGLPPCKIHQGWLCVFRNNFDDTKQKQLGYILDTRFLNEWPQLLLETNYVARDFNYYKIGEPVLLFSMDTNEIIEFDIPFSLIGHSCEIVESIRHLTSGKNSCFLTMEKAQNMEAALFEKLANTYLLERPNIRLPTDGMVKTTQTEFIPIQIFHCTDDDDFECISKASANSSYFESFDEAEYSSMISIEIHHNITNLIRGKVFFIRSERSSDEIWQHYKVNFVHINETDRSLANVSGPLGYETGRPLIIGHKLLLNETAEHIDSNLAMSYFHPNWTGPIHMHIPRRRKDRCEQSQSTVNFGESLLVQCPVQLDNSTYVDSDTNFTRICGELQDRSLQFLQASNILSLHDDYFLSVLGYPANKSDFWVKIDIQDYEHLPVIGMFLDKEHAFICQNMILGLKFEFLTVKDNLQGASDQNVLKKAKVAVGKRHDLQFQLDEVISIPITFSVVFQDLREVSNVAQWLRSCNGLLVSIFISFLLYEIIASK